MDGQKGAGPPRLATPRIHPDAFIAHSATVAGEVIVGRGAVIMFGVVIRAEFDVIEIGSESNVQDNSVVHCDEGYPCRIGDRVTVGHRAVVHGAVVGDRCLIGIGAVLLNGSEVGEGAWLGAGSLLPEGRSIPAWTLAVGSPAKPIRELRPDEVARQDSGIETYLRLAAAYGASAT